MYSYLFLLHRSSSKVTQEKIHDTQNVTGVIILRKYENRFFHKLSFVTYGILASKD